MGSVCGGRPSVIGSDRPAVLRHQAWFRVANEPSYDIWLATLGTRDRRIRRPGFALTCGRARDGGRDRRGWGMIGHKRRWLEVAAVFCCTVTRPYLIERYDSAPIAGSRR